MNGFNTAWHQFYYSNFRYRPTRFVLGNGKVALPKTNKRPWAKQ